MSIIIFCGNIMATDGNNIKQKLSNKYYCENCHYGTSRKSNMDTHCLSMKHIKSTNGNKNKQIKQKIKQCTTENYNCEICKKCYNDRTGLWKHRNKGTCIQPANEIIETSIDVKSSNIELAPQLIQLITELVKGQNGLQESILELCKNGTNNTINTHTNSHNKAFNLNLFLNETCKDAMNIMDFVESIKLQVSDLESVGELGYIEGISNIIVKNLNALDVTQRPVHCTDKKRETIYIKDDNKWEKDEERKMMHKMIKKVADKNARLLPKFTEKYPDYKNYHSKTSDIYSKIIIEAMGGSGDNDYEKEEKIIKNITKNIVVDKYCCASV